MAELAPLAAYVAELRRALLEDLTAGRLPRTGTTDARAWREAVDGGRPQMGSVTLAPDRIRLEFLSGADGGQRIVHVDIEPPERIVFLPVPDWVVENIWQGDVAGSAHFERHARGMLDRFLARLEPAANAAEFAPRPPQSRE
jgi:hypothetical protein